jgi:hypothetical protein
MGERLNTVSDQFIHSKALRNLGCVELMDPDVFNMVVRILAPKALEKSKGQ